MLRTLLLFVVVAFATTSMPTEADARPRPSKWSMKSKSQAKTQSRADRQTVARKSTKSTKRSTPIKAKRATRVEKRPLLF